MSISRQWRAVAARLPVVGAFVPLWILLAAAVGTLTFSKCTLAAEKPATYWTQPEGLTPEVPEPWTPVKTRSQKSAVRGQKAELVEVWGRQYAFDGLPVPASVSAKPSPLSKAEPLPASVELLAAPMDLPIVVGGKKVEWQKRSFKVESKRPSAVVFVSENEVEGLVLRARTTVEFDGMIRVDLALASTGEPVTVDQMDLVIPYRKAIAELMSTYRKAQGPGTQTDRYLGKVPGQPWKHAVFFTHFVGNNEVGLEWFCDDLRGWRVEKGDEAVEIAPASDRVNLIFHLIDHPVRVEKPIEITFGLIATPTKPVPVGWEKLRIDQHFGPPPVAGYFWGDAGRAATQAESDEWVRRQKYADIRANLIFSPAWSGVDWFHYPLDLSTEYGQKAKKQVEIAHAAGQKYCVHGGWYCIPTGIKEWPLWGHEMIAQPPGNSGGVVDVPNFNACYNSPYTSFLVANFAANARLAGIDGVRFDTIAPQVLCNSLPHGCGWYDEQGKLQSSVNIFATREFFKRIYRVFHGGVRQEGLVYFPLAGPPIMAIDSFVDVHEIGEGSFEHLKTLKEAYPQADVRVRHTGTAYGFITSSNLKGAHLHPNKRMAALFVAGANPRVGGAGMPNYYSVGYEKLWAINSNVVRIWDAWKWIDVGHSALWKPYWKNGDTISVAAGPAETYASYYVQPGKRILLIVANYEVNALPEVRVTLDLAKLGFSPGATLFAEDAITQQPVTIKGGVLTFDIYGERYRMMKISVDRPRFAEDRLGPNLFAAGDFESFPDDSVSLPPIGGQPNTMITRDTGVTRTGGAGLRLQRADSSQGGTPEAVFKGARVEPNTSYLLSGYVKIDADFPEQHWISVGLANRDGVITDPPREFARVTGEFLIGEKTPGWKYFLVPFQTRDQTTQVGVSIKQIGTGTAWVDDVQIRKVME